MRQSGMMIVRLTISFYRPRAPNYQKNADNTEILTSGRTNVSLSALSGQS